MQSCSVNNARTIPGIRVIDASFNNEPVVIFAIGLNNIKQHNRK